MDQHAQMQAQRSMREGGGAGDSPRGRLRSGAPAGVCCVESLTKSFRKLKTPRPPRVVSPAQLCDPDGPTRLQLGSILVQLGRSCRSLGSILVQLGSTWLNLAHLWSNLAQLGSNLAHLWSNLALSWSNLAQLGSNLAAKTLPKSSQVGSKIHQKIDHMGSCWQDVRDSQKPQIC